MALADFPIADSITISNAVTAPGAGGNFTGTVTPAAGIYKITWGYALSGTTETTLNNVRLKANALNIGTTMPSITGAGWMSGVIDRVTLDGVNPVSLSVGSAGTAGAVYSGALTLTRIG